VEWRSRLLSVDAPENVLQGGASGPSVIPGKAQRSLLYTRLTDTTAKRMPPAGTLTEERLAMIRAWINSGAKIEPGSERKTLIFPRISMDSRSR
jgi:hypothetical protein